MLQRIVKRQAYMAKRVKEGQADDPPLLSPLSLHAWEDNTSFSDLSKVNYWSLTPVQTKTQHFTSPLHCNNNNLKQ